VNFLKFAINVKLWQNLACVMCITKLRSASGGGASPPDPLTKDPAGEKLQSPIIVSCYSAGHTQQTTIWPPYFSRGAPYVYVVTVLTQYFPVYTKRISVILKLSGSGSRVSSQPSRRHMLLIQLYGARINWRPNAHVCFMYCVSRTER